MKFTGIVSEGVQVGSKFGIATANLRFEVIPELEEGVYLVKVQAPESLELAGVLHFGERKTFGAEFSAEVHILDFDQDIYGASLEIEILKKLRDIQVFPNSDALFTQIETDILRAQKYFLRAKIHTQWQSLKNKEREALAEAAYNTVSKMPEFQTAKVVYIYAPDDFEINFVEKLCKNNPSKIWYFPIINDGKMMFQQSLYQDLRPGYLDLLEPPQTRAQIDLKNQSPGLVLVPAVAASPDGQRLGRGGGFYDKFLKHNWAPTMAILPDFAVLPEIPCEKHDQSIDKTLKI